jgi:hypothetical protein
VIRDDDLEPLLRGAQQGFEVVVADHVRAQLPVIS